ncbi:MAG: potassium channel protein [Prolixibacteraceae bacterium]|jgi:voltage-gated potassium channel|nr:potassium channel protein [Prolixibacteraceae bacterium]
MNKFQEQSSRTIRSGIVLLITMVIGGAIGYRLIEGLNWIDSFYMTVITVSTVGFREVQPLSDFGKLFTTVLIFFSLGSIAYIGYLARFIFDGDFLKYYRAYRVEKRIDRLYNHVIVCGYGRNGEQVGKELASHNTPFVVIDNRENVLSRISRHNPDIMYINGDATHEDVLIRAGVQRAKALIATTPSDADNVFVVLTARSLNSKMKIISRAIDSHSDEKLKRAGADNVIMPELIGGQRMAKLVAQPDVVEFVEYVLLQDSVEVSLEEISCRDIADNYRGRPISHFKQREISGANIVGIKDRNGHYVFNPGSEYILEEEDQLFVLGAPEQLNMFRKVLEETNEF